MEDALQAWIEERHPGARLAHTWPLTGGVSALMTAFEAVDAEGAAHRYILRQPGAATQEPPNPAAARKEHAVLTWLADRSVPAPHCHALDADGERFGAPSVIVDYLDGAPDWSPAEPTGFARRMAETLASIHALDGAADAFPFLRRRSRERVAQVLAAHPPELEVDKVYAAALSGWTARPNPQVLLHGDFWPGNVLWREGRLAAVIDWEECMLGEPLSDLATSRLDMLWILDEAAMQTFTEAYLAIHSIDTTDLPCWDLVAALRPGTWLPIWASPWADKGRPDITYETMAAKLKHFAQAAMARLP